ncbi:MAG: DUF72 domain-containing protein [Armatimonadota bacterium]|nr:DUF72 domain-containing protein [Armatimonadota bacterium]MDR7451305.1 DUF72 domain-containing protein [Armatimonadota bacterium]MDR7466792.1 DUF72 domain-containing protein [Armatimonadota bacterium]MDR7492735.1 DUF72 domain-containing protein [Armatimonadota bacterium]MDR7498511.1 DUF72 domain-containing protein [Armatimonadota bacterium]
MLLIGTSGWAYPHWRDRFYPRGVPQTRWLEYYAGHFPTVEVNNTFYRLPTADVFAAWGARTPAEFTFAVKASRYITHVLRLRRPRRPLATFLRRAAGLGSKLGPVLFQLPPRFPVDAERLEAFLRVLPGDVRPVMEFRDPTWHVPEIFDLLDRYRCGYCIMVGPSLRCELVVTARRLYIRFHAPGGAGPAFGRRRLGLWTQRIRELMQEADEGWIYFNNDAEGAALEDARLLRRLLGA